MATLVELIGAEPIRPKLIVDCVNLIDVQVKTKGFTIKAAYATIKTLKRRFVPEVVEGLLDEWLSKLQPHYERWAATKPSSFADYVIARSDDVAEDLLSVTDRRAEKTTHTTAKKYYLKHRESAKRNVIEAIPDLARVVEKHLAEAQSPPAAAQA